MKLSNHKFFILFSAATAAADKNRYIVEWSCSSIFDQAIDADLPGALGNIWDVAHLTVKDIRLHAGMTQAAFAERFCISVRTVQGWETRNRRTPPYLILLLADAVGMLHVGRKGGESDEV